MQGVAIQLLQLCLDGCVLLLCGILCLLCLLCQRAHGAQLLVDILKGGAVRQLLQQMLLFLGLPLDFPLPDQQALLLLLLRLQQLAVQEGLLLGQGLDLGSGGHKLADLGLQLGDGTGVVILALMQLLFQAVFCL